MDAGTKTVEQVAVTKTTTEEPLPTPAQSQGLRGLWFQAGQLGAMTFVLAMFGWLEYQNNARLMDEIAWNRAISQRFRDDLEAERKHDAEQRQKIMNRLKDIQEMIRNPPK